MSPTGTSQTRLIVLRGNSGSGKSTTARALRERLGRRLALVEQDYLRRIVLKARDTADGPHHGLIEQTVRYALDVGYDVVVLEGILHRQRYLPLLSRLRDDHLGTTLAYYFDVSWGETLRRHAMRPQSDEFGPDEMRRWYCPRDLLGWPEERLVPESATPAETTTRILAELDRTGMTAAGFQLRLVSLRNRSRRIPSVSRCAASSTERCAQ
ncbi:AAA family ATPase [Saccharopolyspora rosea]|uniref:AAA family ATPase n=1 Tax=Saccharopolyspora rosea TaxID=524884 RepID=UPI0021D90E5C|nr:AAA family ATPase [Saccharopolyspora rosea]